MRTKTEARDDGTDNPHYTWVMAAILYGVGATIGAIR